MFIERYYRKRFLGYVFIVYAIAFWGCDLLINGDSIPVEVYLELSQDTVASNNGVVISDIEINISQLDMSFSSKVNQSLALAESTFTMSPDSVSQIILSEQFIEPDIFKNLGLILGPSQDQNTSGAIFIKGLYQEKEFEIDFSERTELQLNFTPPLNIQAATDSLALIIIHVNYSEWFIDDSANVLDPTDISNHERIRSNILSSFVIGNTSIIDSVCGRRRNDPCSTRNNNEEDIQIVISDSAQVEHAPAIDFKIYLDRASRDTVTVNYHTKNNSAKAGIDFEADSNAVSFEPGETEKTISITLIDDNEKEPDEKFTLILSDPIGATLHPSDRQATGTIINDDDNNQGTDLPIVTISDAQAKEADLKMDFIVTLSNASTSDVAISFETKNNSAKANDDYNSREGRIVFQPGETEKTISIALIDDNEKEPDEKFTLILSDPIGATLHPSDRQATGTIINDDDKK